MTDLVTDDSCSFLLQELLPSHQPRFIVYSYKMIHDDRVSFPLCFIFYTPRDSMVRKFNLIRRILNHCSFVFFKMELQMLYAGSKLLLQKEADLTRSYEIRDLDDFTEDWLREKLQ